MFATNTIYDVYEVVFRFSDLQKVGTSYYFPQDKHISNNIVRAVQCVSAGTEVPTTFGPPNALPAPDSRLKATFLTLVCIKNGIADEFVKDMPLINLVRVKNSSRLPEFRKRIDLTKSYIKFTDAGAGFSIDEFIQFYFHLERPPVNK